MIEGMAKDAVQSGIHLTTRRWITEQDMVELFKKAFLRITWAKKNGCSLDRVGEWDCLPQGGSSGTDYRKKTVYDTSWRIIYYVKKDRVYTISWSLAYHLEESKVYDPSWRLVARIDGNQVYSEDWSLLYRIDGDRIYDPNWRLV